MSVVKHQTLRIASGFAAVGISGVVVNLLIFWLFVNVADIRISVAAILATLVSSTWNFILNEMFVFRGNPGGRRFMRYLGFMAINGLSLIPRVPILVFLTYRLHVNYLLANLFTLVLLFGVRFAVSDRLIWRNRLPAEVVERRSPVQIFVDQKVMEYDRPAHTLVRTRYNRKPPRLYLYDIHHLVSIRSEVRLPELTPFLCDELDRKADIRIVRGSVGNRSPRRRTSALNVPGRLFSYLEHCGSVGANFRVDFKKNITVTVSPLLAHSPHVLYTNVLEAMLRFVLVSHGYMLLHSATLELGGRGIMLSARTDTGKTGTVLRLMREQDSGLFLSDDMTIIDGRGGALSFPKPLTISAHTLRAVQSDSLSRPQRVLLAVQSRVHSKDGRTFALWLARANIPILAINAITQIVVPPPKYWIKQLVPCQETGSTQVRRLFLIARGEHHDAPVSYEDAVEALLANTEDAYGFPPFETFAPAITLGEVNNLALRAKERMILESFLRHVTVTELVRDDFSWADAIPLALAAELSEEPIDLREQDRLAALDAGLTGAPGVVVVMPEAVHDLVAAETLSATAEVELN